MASGRRTCVPTLDTEPSAGVTVLVVTWEQPQRHGWCRHLLARLERLIGDREAATVEHRHRDRVRRNRRVRQ
jgi:hypothetical protein